jgi:hypothetical protein
MLRPSFLSACVVAVALPLAFFLCSSTAASAGNYTVAYGYDDVEYSEAGKLECNYEKSCDLKLKNGNIRLSLDFNDSKRKVVTITIFRTNWGPGCCYFDSGTSRSRRDPGSRIVLNLFFGRAQRGLEYVENMQFGSLNLLFSDPN